MLALKTGYQLNWGDLQYIESLMIAKLTLKSNHGAIIGGSPILNACDHNLPNSWTRAFDPYGEINRKLDQGQVFLVNSHTNNPLFTKIEISKQNTAIWDIAQGQNPFLKNAVDAAMCHINVPRITGTYGSKPKEQKETEKEERKPREKHVFLLDAECKDDRPLPEQCKMTLVVQNETKEYLAIRQKMEIIQNGFSKKIVVDQGDKFKVYAFNNRMKEVAEDYKKNGNIKQSISNNLIQPLSFTTESRTDGVVLHQVNVKVTGKTTFKMTRIKQTPHSTISELTTEHDPSKKWYVLEAGGPDSKVSGKGRIEKGAYQFAPYSSKNYPEEFQLKHVPGRKNIIMYEYDDNKSLTTGLALGTSYDFTDDKKQYYKVDNSAKAKQEIYEIIGDGEAEIVIDADLSLKILKDELWTKHEILNEYAAGYKEFQLRKGSKGDLVKFVQQALNNVGFHVVEDSDYGSSLHLAVKYFQKFYNKDFDSRKEVHAITELKVDACIGKKTLLALDEALVNKWKVDLTEAENRVRAFLRMIRVGEGTVGDIGYETLFTHKSFIKDFGRDYSTHPNIVMKGGGLESTAAGAYQILYDRWKDVSKQLYTKRQSILDFSADSQDKLGICLLRFRSFGSGGFKVLDKDTGDKMSVLELLLSNRITDAVNLASWEWASLPPGRYGQPNKTMDEALDYYKGYLEDETCHQTDLKIDRNVISEFIS